MTVALIGSGNVATVLGRELLVRGHKIATVWSRQRQHATQLAGELGAVTVSEPEQLSGGLDLYIIAVSDDSLPLVASRLRLKDELVAHTAGSVSKEILKGCSRNYGVLWPMKMIRKNMQSLGEVTIVVDGNTPAVKERLKDLATRLATHVTQADDELRLKLHMLASVTANFTNHLYHLAADYCGAEGIDFSLLYPIIGDTAKRIRSAYPGNVQAGPAFRGDTATLAKHEALLRAHPKLSALYAAISRSIMEK